jgi:twinkle protein
MKPANSWTPASYLDRYKTETPAPTSLKELPRTDIPLKLRDGKASTLDKRGITEKTCRTYDYLIGSYNGNEAHLANYRNSDGVVTAQHIRYGGKQFAWIRPKGAKLQLFGQHLGSDGLLVICEGEIDCMTVFQVMHEWGHHRKFCVVSIADGAASGKKNVTEQIGWVMGFSQVVVFMDMDEPGQAAAKAIAEVIGPKAAVVGNFPYKDANEALLAGDDKAIREAIRTAKRHRPDAIVHAPDLLEKVLKPEHRFGLPYPWDGWNQMTEGMKPGQLVMVAGGTGIGKSLFTRSICLNLTRAGTKCAYIGLEESCETSLERMLSEVLGYAPGFHLDTAEQRERRDPEVIRKALDTFAENLFLLDKFGSEDFDAFVATVKHYVLGEQCQVVFLDHFSLLADGISLATDQRRAIDKCIKDLKTLCVELNFTMVVVCHLSRGSGIGPSHEEGGEPTLAELRGSHSLAQIPDFVVMLQRNPRAEDKVDANTTNCWLKKNRVKGELGLMSRLQFLESCRFHEIKTH